MSKPEDTEQERLVRNISELLQELRVAQAGVQILFGFLLAVAFTDRFGHAGSFIRGTHLVTVLLATCAIALLTAPAAWHRLLFRHRRREEIVRNGNRFALLGMAFLAAAMTGTVLLVGVVVVGGWLAPLLAGLTALGFFLLWFAAPFRIRLRANEIRDLNTVPDDGRPAPPP